MIPNRLIKTALFFIQTFDTYYMYEHVWKWFMEG